MYLVEELWNEGKQFVVESLNDVFGVTDLKPRRTSHVECSDKYHRPRSAYSVNMSLEEGRRAGFLMDEKDGAHWFGSGGEKYICIPAVYGIRAVELIPGAPLGKKEIYIFMPTQQLWVSMADLRAKFHHK